jgi:hypothetical protein
MKTKDPGFSRGLIVWGWLDCCAWFLSRGRTGFDSPHLHTPSNVYILP